MKRNVLTVLCVLMLAAGTAMADRPVNESAAAAPDGTVEISNIAGSIVVEGWPRAEVELSGTVSDDVERVVFEAEGDRTRIEVKYPRKGKNHAQAHIKVMVPVGATVEIEGVSADVEVKGVDGSIDAESVSGDVNVFGTPEEVEAASVSGDVTIELAAGKTELATVSGDIIVREVRGDLSAESVSGDIRIEEGLLTGGEFETVSGNIEMSVAFDRGHIEMESMSGNLDLTIPASTAADFEIESFSGSIHNELTGDRAKRSDDHGPGRELEFSSGSGGPKVEMTSFSGSVTIKTN